MTLKDFILTKTLGTKRDAAKDTTAQLMGSSRNAARLQEAIAAPATEHRVFESVEDLKDAPGI